MKEKIVDLRKQVIDYLQNELQTPAEYLWKKFPTYAVFRNERNNKWFAAIMNINFNKIDSSNNKVASVKDKMFNVNNEYFITGYKDELQLKGGFFSTSSQI